MSAHRAPSILNTEYRHSWLNDWLALGDRGRRMIQAALDDLTNCYLRDVFKCKDTAVAIADLINALTYSHPVQRRRSR